METATAHLLGHRIALRRRLAELGIAQPAFAAVRTLHEGRVALESVGVPSSLVAADSAPGAARFVVESVGDLERHLHAALAESPAHEAILEQISTGRGLSALARTDSGQIRVAALCDTLPYPSIGLVWPTRLFGDELAQAENLVVRAVRAVGLAQGTAVIDLVVSDEGLRVLEISAGDGETIGKLTGQAPQPAAIPYLTAEPGPLPTGRVRQIGSLEKVLAFPGVVEADIGLAVGDTIEPMRLNGATHGYVLAVGDTNLEALDRAEAGSRLVDVEVW